MDITALNIPWAQFIAYAALIISIASLMTTLKMRVDILEKNDKKQDNKIDDNCKSFTTTDKAVAVLISKMDSLIQEMKKDRA